MPVNNLLPDDPLLPKHVNEMPIPSPPTEDTPKAESGLSADLDEENLPNRQPKAAEPTKNEEKKSEQENKPEPDDQNPFSQPKAAEPTKNEEKKSEIENKPEPDDQNSLSQPKAAEPTKNEEKKSEIKNEPEPDDQNALCNLKAEVDNSLETNKHNLDNLMTTLLPDTQDSKYVCPTQLHDKFCSKIIDNADCPCPTKTESVKPLNFETTTTTYEPSTPSENELTYEGMMYLLS